MSILKSRSILMASGIASAIFAGSLAAQGLDQLKDITGGAAVGGAASSLGSLSSIASGSMGNAAGIIDFCTKNNFLSGEGASSVKNQLLGKLSGSENKPAESNADYIKGTKGIVISSGGQTVDLSMAGLKASAVKTACEKILEQGKSMLSAGISP